jgi:hypothetical protein
MGMFSARIKRGRKGGTNATTRFGFAVLDIMRAIIWIVLPILQHRQVTTVRALLRQPTPFRPIQNSVSIRVIRESAHDGPPEDHQHTFRIPAYASSRVILAGKAGGLL